MVTESVSGDILIGESLSRFSRGSLFPPKGAEVLARLTRKAFDDEESTTNLIGTVRESSAEGVVVIEPLDGGAWAVVKARTTSPIGTTITQLFEASPQSDIGTADIVASPDTSKVHLGQISLL